MIKCPIFLLSILLFICMFSNVTGQSCEDLIVPQVGNGNCLPISLGIDVTTNAGGCVLSSTLPGPNCGPGPTVGGQCFSVIWDPVGAVGGVSADDCPILGLTILSITSGNPSSITFSVSIPVIYYLNGFDVIIDSIKCTISSEDFLVTSVPSYDGTFPSFKQYAGYITVDKSHGRNLFFWFVESQHDPVNDPVILWLQGGPGCSSMLGFTAEHGPFRPDISNKEGEMEPNGWSWNRIANMLYVDAPAGVGFSYSNTPSDYNTNDNKTADDNYTFLKNWFEIFSEYKKNDFWITGESYAGVYIPTLAYRVVFGEDIGLKTRLKGLMLGNPVIDCPQYGVNVNGLSLQADMFFWHGLIPYHQWHEFNEAGCQAIHPPNPDKCQNIYDTFNVGTLDTDDLYTNFCTGNGTLNFLEEVPSCFNFHDALSVWLNRADVQKSIHVHSTHWEECTNKLNYTRSHDDMLSYLKHVYTAKTDLHILFYSGDVDIATVPFAYTQFCLYQLHRPLVKKWREYRLPEYPKQTAGFIEDYDKYSYATIKGAGHEAPLYQPAQAFFMFSNFLKHATIPM